MLAIIPPGFAVVFCRGNRGFRQHQEWCVLSCALSGLPAAGLTWDNGWGFAGGNVAVGNEDVDGDAAAGQVRKAGISGNWQGYPSTVCTYGFFSLLFSSASCVFIQ